MPFDIFHSILSFLDCSDLVRLHRLNRFTHFFLSKNKIAKPWPTLAIGFSIGDASFFFNHNLKRVCRMRGRIIFYSGEVFEMVANDKHFAGNRCRSLSNSTAPGLVHFWLSDDDWDAARGEVFTLLRILLRHVAPTRCFVDNFSPSRLRGLGVFIPGSLEFEFHNKLGDAERSDLIRLVTESPQLEKLLLDVAPWPEFFTATAVKRLRHFSVSSSKEDGTFFDDDMLLSLRAEYGNVPYRQTSLTAEGMSRFLLEWSQGRRDISEFELFLRENIVGDFLEALNELPVKLTDLLNGTSFFVNARKEIVRVDEATLCLTVDKAGCCRCYRRVQLIATNAPC